MAKRYIECREVPGSDDGDMVTLESADGHKMSVHGSYLEQEVDALMSPYNNGELVFCDDLHPDGERFITNDDRYVDSDAVIKFERTKKAPEVWVVIQRSECGFEVYLHGAFADFDTAMVHRDKVRDEHNEVKRAMGHTEDGDEVIFAKTTDLIC